MTTTTTTTHNDYILYANLAEKAKRFEDMKQSIINLVIETKNDLTIEERNLLNFAYKNIIANKRKSIRYLLSTKSMSNENYDLINDYINKIQYELKLTIDEFIDLIDKHLIPHSKSNLESKSFYLKLKADLLRILIDYCDNENYIEKDKLITQVNFAYKNAFDLVKRELSTCNPIRLGLELSYSLFIYEILNMQEQARDLAKQSFDNAIMDLDLDENKKYIKDSKLLIDLLRDNFIMWTQQIDEIENESF